MKRKEYYLVLNHTPLQNITHLTARLEL